LKVAYIIATFFGVGYFPKAPGTAGSLATIPFAFLLNFYCGAVPAMLAFFVLVYAAGTWASKEVLKHTSHDPSFIVIDEVAGQLIPLIYISTFAESQSEWLIYAAISFVLFRIFDIAKPFPVGYFDKKVLNAHGVMLDDIAAGIYALVFLIFLNVILIRFS